jgi:hypothetical protein
MDGTTSDQGGEPLRIELYVRRDAFGARTQQQRLFERVRRLEERSGIEETAVRRWPSRILADERSELVGVIREFESWTAERGPSLAPSFERRVVEPGFTDERFEQVVLPVMCLAVYQGGRLRYVAPHVDGRQAVTVHDCIEDLQERLGREDGRPSRRFDAVVPP